MFGKTQNILWIQPLKIKPSIDLKQKMEVLGDKWNIRQQPII